MVLMDRRRLANILTHLLFIILLVVLPEVLMSLSGLSRGGHFRWGFYAKSLVLLGVFYVNFFVLVPRFLGGPRHRWLAFVGINAVLIVAAIWLQYAFMVWGWVPGGRRMQRTPDEWHRIFAAASFMLRDAFSLLLTASLAVTLRLSGNWRTLAERQEKLDSMQRESELAGLRSQLNPHFLFNTLNSIYALIEICPDQARDAVHDLAQMLRYVVYENPQYVEIGRELDFIRRYTELMRLRTGERPMECVIAVGDTARPIAPLLLLPLVENAFKYGTTAPADRPIRIAVTQDCEGLLCRTDNYFAPARTTSIKGGVGLSNLRRRIELLYGERASLTTHSDGERYVAELRLR